jgi:hypothetical protein
MTRHRIQYLALALATAVFAPMLPAGAQEPERETVPLKFSVRSKVDLAATFKIPMDPPLISQKLTGVGQAPLLGNFTTVEHVFIYADQDGNALMEDVVGALSNEQRDYLFYTVRGISQKLEYAFTITGGKGRFRGASGSGIMKPEMSDDPNQFTCHFEGTISIAKTYQ